MELRQMKGLEIAEKGHIKPSKRGWYVPSQSGHGQYEVYNRGEKTLCTCPDCESRGVKCKHQWAIEYFVQKKTDSQGNRTITEVVKKTYSQDWKAYTSAQNSEITLFDSLLSNLVADVEEAPQTMGRPRLSTSDLLFCSIQKVYSQLSSRRAKTLYGNAKGKAQIGKNPNYNSINIFLNREDLTPILENLLVVSALPLKSLETTFAPDSSGFRTSQFTEYYGVKYNAPRIHQWVKAHIMVGVKTNVIVSAYVTTTNVNDCTMFAPLVNSAHDNGFQIKEVVADKGYLSRENYDLVDSIGGSAYIPFKWSNVQKSCGSKVWFKMFHYFQMYKDEFLQHYHQRSNVESVFHMIKMKFGDKLKSKNPIAQKNELLCKLIAHNIVVLIHEMHELGIKPEFHKPS